MCDINYNNLLSQVDDKSIETIYYEVYRHQALHNCVEWYYTNHIHQVLSVCEYYSNTIKFEDANGTLSADSEVLDEIIHSTQIGEDLDLDLSNSEHLNILSDCLEYYISNMLK